MAAKVPVLAKSVQSRSEVVALAAHRALSILYNLVISQELTAAVNQARPILPIAFEQIVGQRRRRSVSKQYSIQLAILDDAPLHLATRSATKVQYPMILAVVYCAAEHRHIAALDANTRAATARNIATRQLDLAPRILAVDVHAVILRNRWRRVPNRKAEDRDGAAITQIHVERRLVGLVALPIEHDASAAGEQLDGLAYQ